MNIVVMISLMVLATFSVRAVSICLFAGRVLSPLTHRALSLVPIAILSAICGPLIFRPEGDWVNPLFLIEFWAAIGTIFAVRLGALPAIGLGISIYGFGKFFI